MIKEQAKQEAINFRQRVIAEEVSDEELYENQHLIPEWSDKKDYSKCEVGTPIKYKNEIYILKDPKSISKKDFENDKKGWSKKSKNKSLIEE